MILIDNATLEELNRTIEVRKSAIDVRNRTIEVRNVWQKTYSTVG